jgi:hypothetical protein
MVFSCIFVAQFNSMRRYFIAAAIALLLGQSAPGATIALWNFNSVPADSDTGTGSLQPTIGSGVAFLVGTVTASFTAANGSSDVNADNSNWRITSWPVQSTQNKQNGIGFRTSTVGCRNLSISWDLRNSNTASKYIRLQYTTNAVDYVDFQLITMPAETWVNGQTSSFVGVAGVENNPAFGIRFVTEFQNTATGSGVAGYVPSSPTSTYGTVGTLRFDQVLLSGDEVLSNFSVLSYNIQGGGATNWSLDHPQVQAIGRQLAHLRPDIVGFQEIPEAWHTLMDEFVALYLPGYSVATGSKTDGYERSGVASRYPITRAQSWLPRSDLSAFGYSGPFTRDLFEAEIAMPGFEQPLHFFTTHLKASGDETSASRRGAEARAISNFIAMAFLTTNAHRPYLLVGDMNEDILRPRAYEQRAIQTLASPPTDLKLTTPRNPVTQDERTWSIRNAALTLRFDYVLPCGMLFSNLTGAQVFRTDILNPVPPPLLTGDSATGADHLPIWVVFSNPYKSAVNNSLSIQASGNVLRLTWSSSPQGFRLESCQDLTTGEWKPYPTQPQFFGNGYLVSITDLLPSEFFRLAR